MESTPQFPGIQPGRGGVLKSRTGRKNSGPGNLATAVGVGRSRIAARPGFLYPGMLPSIRRNWIGPMRNWKLLHRLTPISTEGAVLPASLPRKVPEAVPAVEKAVLPALLPKAALPAVPAALVAEPKPAEAPVVLLVQLVVPVIFGPVPAIPFPVITATGAAVCTGDWIFRPPGGTPYLCRKIRSSDRLHDGLFWFRIWRLRQCDHDPA